jgi:hypothetical protein
MMKATSRLLDGTQDERRQAFLDVTDGVVDPIQHQKYTQATSRLGTLPQVERDLLLRDLDADIAATQEFLESFASTTGAKELMQAEASGLLRIETLGLSSRSFVKNTIRVGHGASDFGSTEEAVSAFKGQLRDLVSAGSSAYPLLDDSARGVAEDMFTTGKVPDPVFVPRQGQLAGHIVSRIPGLRPASMEEILAARYELLTPLAKFRAGVITLGQQMTTAPWDADFERQADEAFDGVVWPALQELYELDEQRSSSATLRRMARNARNPAKTAGATIALGVAIVPFMPELAAAVLTVGTSLSASASAAIDEIHARDDFQARTEQSQFLFLHEAAAKLGKSPKRGRLATQT